MSGVIHIITQLERGGAQRNTLETAARLHHVGRPQWLWTGEPGPLDDEAAKRLGQRFSSVRHLVHEASPVADALALGALTARLSRAVHVLRPPVVVHTHSTKAGLLGRLAARAVAGVRVVHTVHGFGFGALGENRRWIIEGAERIAARATDVAVFVSEADQREAARMGLFRAVRTEVIRSGIDVKHFAVSRDPSAQERARARFQIRADASVAVTVANLKQQKDPLFHVEVLAAWRQLDPRATLLLVGDGPLRGAVIAHAARLGVADRLVLPGFVDDPRDAYAAADAYLLCSAWEGLPRTVLEASAASLWGVVRDSGWAGDIGWARHIRAFPGASPATDLASALPAAVAATRACRRTSRVPPAFTLAGMLADLERLYDDLVGVPGLTEAERFQSRRRPRRRRERP